jgi:tRNA A-37 threonylcarbamoyl transferase component Bud32
MVESVEELHNADYIHKDIKPDNFRVHKNKVLLIDFGLAMEYKIDNKHKPRG